MTDAQKFGANLQRARHERGLSQSELAGRVDVETSYISTIENGRNTPSFALVMKLARALGIPPAELFADIK